MTFSERKASFGLAKILFFQRTYLDANIASLIASKISIVSITPSSAPGGGTTLATTE